MKQNNRIFYVFDNTGTENETADNFTIVLNNGDLLGCNSYPNRPYSVAMHNGNLVDNIMFVKYGARWRDRCNVRPIVRAEVTNYLSEARNDPNWLGNEVTDFNILPVDVQYFIKQNLY